jgi:hypothetical protein
VQDVARAEAPESLQQKALALGMVPVAAPVFLRLSDGAVLGSPRPAQADPAARIPATGGTGTAPSTPSSPSAAAATRPAARPAPRTFRQATTCVARGCGSSARSSS